MVIYLATVSAPTNIAVIKYWGKANVKYNTPINDSLSVTLDQQDLRAVTTVAASSDFTHHRLWLNGVEDLDIDTNERFQQCIVGVKALAVDVEKWKDLKIHVSSYNTFPTAAGLASSAAGYAALVAALAKLMAPIVESFPGQLSTIARQGSGSASRSMYGGFVAWRKGSAENDWMDSKAECIRDETHWPQLRALICVVSATKKDTSSTTGMNTSVATSRLLSHRAEQIVPDRMEQMEHAIIERDFTTFAELTMQDSNQFHATCLDTYPPIFYLNDISRNIIRVLTTYNNYYNNNNGGAGPRAAYTFDAGPNAVVYCLDEHVVEITALLMHYFPPNSNNNTIAAAAVAELTDQVASYTLNTALLDQCDQVTFVYDSGTAVQSIYYTRPGPGPLDVTDICNLDSITGLNTYHPTTTTTTAQP